VPLCLCGLRAGVGALLAAALLACGRGADRGTLPAALSDEAFWQLSTSLSEPPGVFTHSDNLVSNELLFVHTVQRLRARGGVYVGVGPEQNFSYIARVGPAMAFIVDIRQENRNLHLLYKALFETSGDRAAFVSRLFSRQLARVPSSDASVQELFDALAAAIPSAAMRDATTAAVRAHLLETRTLALAAEDLASIDRALDAFFTRGPDIDYGWSRPKSDPHPSYRTLMTATDLGGASRSYLASEETFTLVKRLHAGNLIVPVVGDFGGSRRILERVGDYVRQHGSTISAFYSSNVEVYLSNQQVKAYCEGLRTLPVRSSTAFISNRWLQPFARKLQTCRPRTTLIWEPRKP
jgi:hypothetical protein